MPAEPQIHRLPTAAAGDTAVVHHLTELINTVYDDAESALWQEEVARTDTDEVAASIAAGQIIVARLGRSGEENGSGDGQRDSGGPQSGERGSGSDDPPGAIIGVVQAHATDGRGWFGMLAVDSGSRSAGIGRRLVGGAEDLAREAGATEIEISVIMTTDESFAPKVELAAWYQRLGYELAEVVSVAESIPGMEDLLAVDCHMQILRKTLSTK